DSGPERLGTGLLGGKTLGVGRDHHFLVLGAALRLGALGVGEDAVEKALAMALDHLGDAADIDQVVADADDHQVMPAPCPGASRSAWCGRSRSGPRRSPRQSCNSRC